MAVFGAAAFGSVASMRIELPDGFDSIEASTESDRPAASAVWSSTAGFLVGLNFEWVCLADFVVV